MYQKSGKNDILSSLLAICLSASLTACNSGSQPQTNTTQANNTTNLLATQQPYTAPDNSTLVAGVKLYTTNNTLLATPGRKVSTYLYLSGNISSATKFGLKANLLDSNGHLINIVNGAKISFSNPDLAITSNSKFGINTQITIDTKNIPAGNYIIQLIATNLPSSPVVSNLNLNVAATNTIKGSYVPLIYGDSTIAQIPNSAYQASNMLIFAFADTTTSAINQDYLKQIQTAINSETAGTINLLSIGGANNSNISDSTDVSTLVSNIVTQINTYNQQLQGGKISGVDLDLEGSFSPETINNIAQQFKQAGLIVSSAPQAYFTDNSSISSDNPTNLALTSGASSPTVNNYALAIANGYIDYINVQTYNTRNFNIDGYTENQIPFYTAIAKALNNTVVSSPSCTSSNLCIPDNTKIIITEVSNQGAGGYTIFNPIGSQQLPVQYNQIAILNQLESAISYTNNNYQHIAGNSQWSLGDDYSPTLHNDTYATAGAYSQYIFGAPAIPPTQPIGIQITNTGPNIAGNQAYAAVTLVINGSWDVFGVYWSQSNPNNPISPGDNPIWSNLPGVVGSSTYSNVLQSLLAGGQSSFTASEILIDAYPNQQTSVSKPSAQYVCGSGAYTFNAGYIYNIMVNPVTGACQITPRSI